jgi:hypothetical protein
MGVCDRKKMEPHTACLGWLYASSRKAPFDPESECEQCKGQLVVDQSTRFDMRYTCAINSAIFTVALRRKNSAYIGRRPQHRERSVQSKASCGKEILLLSLKIMV